MVNCWLGLVVWIPGIPLWKGLLLRGIHRIPNRAPNQQLTISWTTAAIGIKKKQPSNLSMCDWPWCLEKVNQNYDYLKVWKIMFLSKWVICRFHVSLPGGRSWWWFSSHGIPIRTQKKTQIQATWNTCFCPRFSFTHLSQEKKNLTFQYTGCWMGILIMVYYNPHITG